MKEKLVRLIKYAINCALIVAIAFTLSIMINSVTAAVVEWNEPTCTDPEICNVSSLVDTSDLMQKKTGQLNLVGVSPEPDLNHTNRLSVYADPDGTDTAIYAEQNNASGYALYASGNIQASGVICDSVGCIGGGGGGIGACSDCDSRFVQNTVAQSINLNGRAINDNVNGGSIYSDSDGLHIGKTNSWIILQEQWRSGGVSIGSDNASDPEGSVHITGQNLRGAFALRVETSGDREAFSIDNSSGNIGVGMLNEDGGYKLHVDGTAYATGAAGALSDIRHKDNVENLSIDALEIIEELRPVTFEWKEPIDAGMEGTQLGLIAQEVEKVLPEAVLTQENEEQTKGLKYSSFIPVLIEAIKEQQKQIEELRTLCKE